MHKALLLCLFIVLVTGCVSQQKTKTPAEERMTESKFRAEGEEYIGSGNQNKLFSLIDEYGTSFPDSAKAFVDTLVIKEMARYTGFQNENDLFSLLFTHNNLNALATIDPLSNETFYRELARKLYEQSFFALSKYYRTTNGFFVSKAEYTPLRSISKYNDLLAEISIIHSYTTDTGLVRKTYPYFSGSGFLVSPTRLVTAYHVIEEVFEPNTVSYKIIAKVQNKELENVKIIGWDSLTDLALLELPEPVDMPYKFYKLLGDSSDLQVGYEVYCLGHHSGYTQTLTKGIVSSVKRKAPEVGSWIQIDAAVSGGASGGLLIGKDNLVYGMIVAGVSYQDINFVVPSNIILEVLDRLEHSKRIERPWLGVILKENTEPGDGVTIFDIFPSSPLNQRNVKTGNKIVKINGTTVRLIDEAQGLLYGLEAGNIAKISLAGEKNAVREFFVVLGRRPDYAIYNATRVFNKLSSLYTNFGFEVLEKPVRSGNYVIKGESYTLSIYEVSKVLPDSYMDCQGVRKGDYIGFIADYFYDKTRYIEVLHIPPDHPYKKPEDVYDQIYVLKKERYDENIL
jgi:S1-C subfamily serine protease